MDSGKIEVWTHTPKSTQAILKMASCTERTTFTPNHGKIEIPKTDWPETIIAALGNRYLIAEHNLPTYFDHGHYGGELNCNFSLYIDNYGQVWKIYLENGTYPEQKKRIIPLNRSDCPLTDYLIDCAKKEWLGHGPSPLNPKSYNGYINCVPTFEGGVRSEFATAALSRHYCGDKTLDAVVLPKIDALEQENRTLKERLATLESIILGNPN